jgi:DNA invertase Pin-like site-specific DNA recombinase
MTHCLAYIRTSTTTNADGDSVPRQRAAIEAYAARAGLTIEGEYADVVTGADPIEGRKGFADLLARITGNGVRMVVVEDASRFARNLMVQEAGIALLQGLGVVLVTAGGENLTDSGDPERVMIRQILGAVAQAEKARLVAKLRAARDRATAARGGRRTVAPRGYAGDAGLIERVRGMKDEGLTLQAIADRLAADGVVSKAGKTLDTTQVWRMLKKAG